MNTILPENQVPDFVDVNFYANDIALQHAVQTHNATWHDAALHALGGTCGSRHSLHLADQANRHAPELQTHDRVGSRIDQVIFDASWHELLGSLREHNLHALPWSLPSPGSHVARAAAYYLHAQVESGSLCPTTMTFAAIPVLQNEPRLFAQLKEKLFATHHDARDVPIGEKTAILIGMGMTEKQGGSDVRGNTTLANAVGAGGRGADYLLNGHKWFFSAPMCDAHLVLARTDAASAALSCFFVPRWRPDGSKNPVHIQRLKDKLGNRSNSSSEVEFHDALGVMVGEEGRGIPTIIEMANLTRLDCVIGSAALMRHALCQAIHHARHRHAFGKALIDQSLMRNVLADLALESEAALHLMMQLASACDAPDDPLLRAWKRIVTPAAKFWICKRALAFTGECMEVWGGNGYVETGPMARLYREAPVNSIWEGSGNVMCLDVLRAISRDPEGMQLLLKELQDSSNAGLQAVADDLRKYLSRPANQQENAARFFAQNLVLALQALLMWRHAPAEIADAFIISRLTAGTEQVFGSMDSRVSEDVQMMIIERALPIA
jgi:putative acyl-CoA dehydrogenase